MTNFEKYHDEVMELKTNLAVVGGHPCDCGKIFCLLCDFYNENRGCLHGRWFWLWSEYKEAEK